MTELNPQPQPNIPERRLDGFGLSVGMVVVGAVVDTVVIVAESATSEHGIEGLVVGSLVALAGAARFRQKLRQMEAPTQPHSN